MEFHLCCDYYVPDLSNKNTDFLFIDSSLEYVAKKNKWRASFKMTLQTKNFEQIQTNDFSTTILEVICCHFFCSIIRLIFRIITIIKKMANS
jgi:hypothetical protein